MAIREGKLVTATSITDFSIEELEAEAERQKKAKIPTVIENPVVTKKLIGSCNEYIEIIQKKRPVENSEHFIFEAAVEAVFGPTVWKWVKKNV